MEINGVYVENLRKKLGLSQDDFANLLGVSRGERLLIMKKERLFLSLNLKFYENWIELKKKAQVCKPTPLFYNLTFR